MLLFAGLIAFATFGRAKFKVRVCMAYNGQSSCKIAAASSEATAVRAATEDACADIASGVTETVACQNTPPQSLNWLKRR